MNDTIAEELDTAISTLFAEAEGTTRAVNLEIAGLLGIAAELRILSNNEFRTQLKADLLRTARTGSRTLVPIHSRLETTLAKSAVQADSPSEFLPTLLGEGCQGYPIQGRSFAASFLAQAAALALVFGLGLWTARYRTAIYRRTTTALIMPESYTMPSATTESGGGGGGGDRDKLQASEGALPRSAAQQIVPPMAVVRNQNSKLAVEPTVIMPPEITFLKAPQLGDPLSAALPPSNGAGSSGGIGSGSGGGVGSGDGPGTGPGTGGGIGGGVFRVGGGVTAPRAIYDPEPEYSEEARKAKFQGNVVLTAIIGPDGRPRDLRVARSLGMGLDQQAIATVNKWRFEPAMRDGHPVAVQVNIEVDFRLY